MDDIDSLHYRGQLWDKEYAHKQDIPSSRTFFPSRALKTFIEKYPDIEKEFAVDGGSGNGRNSFFLIDNGFQRVYGRELSKVAVKFANEKARELKLEDMLTFEQGSMGERLDFEDSSADLVIDMMAMHAMLFEDRANWIEEIKRVLKPGGYFVFYTIATESPAAQDLIEYNPGPEDNSYRFERDGMVFTEKTFTKDELVRILSPLQLIELEAHTEFTPAFGDVYERMYYSGIFQK